MIRSAGAANTDGSLVPIGSMGNPPGRSLAANDGDRIANEVSKNLHPKRGAEKLGVDPCWMTA